MTTYRDSLMLAVVLIAAGAAALALGAAGASRHDTVALQVPYVFSAGLGGVALLAVGAATWWVQRQRLSAARELADIDRLINGLGE